jgi:hypothetical protein
MEAASVKVQRSRERLANQNPPLPQREGDSFSRVNARIQLEPAFTACVTSSFGIESVKIAGSGE